MDIRQNPGKAGIEHVRKFNKSMEDTMKEEKEALNNRVRATPYHEQCTGCSVIEECKKAVAKDGDYADCIKSLQDVEVKGHPRTRKKANTEGVLAGPVCPQCEIPTQLHEGAETCPVHGKVLIDEE